MLTNAAKKLRPKIIDLYAGVGGLSLGAARAGFSLAGAVELDQRAIQLHQTNFPNTCHVESDVAELSGDRLLTECGLKTGGLDGLIGGPPCQGFSSMGRRRVNDPRNTLLGHFFRLVSEAEPAFFIAENVPGILQDRNWPVLNSALELVSNRYTVLQPISVTASEFGVPTSRKRVFFIGFDPERIGQISESDFRAPSESADIRVRDALQSLPAVRRTWQEEYQSWRAIGQMVNSDYADRISGRVPFGVGNPLALELFKAKRLVSGFLGTRHDPETIRRFSILREGETDAISKSVRLDRNGLCPTLRAGTGPERGSYQSVRPVHPTSPRVICPREAARLQGFPDWFQFHPTKWHSFRQIGNSVSPIVAEHLLKVFAKAIT